MELFIKIMLIVILVSFAILSLSGCAAGLVALVRWIGGIV